jgi:hypothetical protein
VWLWAKSFGILHGKDRSSDSWRRGYAVASIPKEVLESSERSKNKAADMEGTMGVSEILQTNRTTTYRINRLQSVCSPST